MSFWILTIGLLVLAVAFCVAGRLVRQYAYHAGQGFGCGAANVPRLFHKIPWPMAWLLGGVFSIVGTVFLLLAVGIGKELRFFILWAMVLGFARFLGDLIFYRLFKNDMKFAYKRLDKFERNMQVRVDASRLIALDEPMDEDEEFRNQALPALGESNAFENVEDAKKPAKSEITLSTNQVEQEILVWEARVLEKENEASDFSLEIQDVKIGMKLFLGEYYLRVGAFYVKLDRLKLRIKEYERRIDVAKGRKLTAEDLENIEAEVDEMFLGERRKVDDLENEASESAEEYNRHVEQEAKKPLDEEFQQELKSIYRRLALKFHPDKAIDEKQARKFQKIFVSINEAYKKGDLETLKKYMKQVEREERIAKETPEEKLARLKNDYERLLGIIAKLQAELDELKADETYKLKEKVDQGKKDGKDLLQKLAADIKAEIAENQARLDRLIAEYKNLI